MTTIRVQVSSPDESIDVTFDQESFEAGGQVIGEEARIINLLSKVVERLAGAYGFNPHEVGYAVSNHRVRSDINEKEPEDADFLREAYDRPKSPIAEDTPEPSDRPYGRGLPIPDDI